MATYHLLDDADPTLTRNVNDVEGVGVFLAAFKLRNDGAVYRRSQVDGRAARHRQFDAW